MISHFREVFFCFALFPLITLHVESTLLPNGPLYRTWLSDKIVLGDPCSSLHLNHLPIQVCKCTSEQVLGILTLIDMDSKRST